MIETITACAVSIPFWKRLVMCFGYDLHLVVDHFGRISTRFKPCPATIPLAILRGQFSIPATKIEVSYGSVAGRLLRETNAPQTPAD